MVATARTIGLLATICLMLGAAQGLKCLCNQAFIAANPTASKAGLQRGISACDLEDGKHVCEVTKAMCGSDTDCKAMMTLITNITGIELKPYCYTEGLEAGLQGCSWMGSEVEERCDGGMNGAISTYRCSSDKCNQGSAWAKGRCAAMGHQKVEE